MGWKDKETRKAYREANRDRIKAYYEANKDRLKSYREANKDRIKAQEKAYREANRDRLKAGNKAYKKIIVNSLSDEYIISVLSNHSSLKRSDIKKCPELIEAKREHIRLKRLLKQI